METYFLALYIWLSAINISFRDIGTDTTPYVPTASVPSILAQSVQDGLAEELEAYAPTSEHERAEGIARACSAYVHRKLTFTTRNRLNRQQGNCTLYADYLAHLINHYYRKYCLPDYRAEVTYGQIVGKDDLINYCDVMTEAVRNTAHRNFFKTHHYVRVFHRRQLLFKVDASLAKIIRERNPS